MNSVTYGEMSVADDITLASGVADDARQDGPALPTEGSALWSYMNEGRINGVPVRVSDRGLKIDREDMLSAAFELHRRPRSVLLYLAPGDDDPGNIRYSSLLDSVADGRIDIIDEVRQWDQEHARFVLWVRYDELEYGLHPRFDFLREE